MVGQRSIRCRSPSHDVFSNLPVSRPLSRFPIVGTIREQQRVTTLFTTADRAKDMRQPPVYVLNHSQHSFKQRSTQADLDEIELWTDRAAARMYEGAGLGPADVRAELARREGVSGVAEKSMRRS